MRRDRREKNKKKKILIFISILITVIIISLFAFFNVTMKEPNIGKIQIVINNNNITAKLKNAAYINEKNVVYMSVPDIKVFLDNYIYNDQVNEQIITTYGEKIGVLSLKENKININDANVELTSGVEQKNGQFFIPISLMSNIYNMEMSFIKDKKVLVMDSLDRELIKMDAAKNLKVRSKSTAFSSVDIIKPKGYPPILQ